MPLDPFFTIQAQRKVDSQRRTRVERKLDVRPGGELAFRRRFTLDGVVVYLHFQFLPRLSRWAVDLRGVDDARVQGSQMVVAGGRLRFDRRLDGMPPGDLYWRGEDEYGAEDLGETVHLMYLDAAPAVSRIPLTMAYLFQIIS